MNAAFVDSLCGVTLAGGGPISGAALARARLRAECIVAADGGADRLIALGADPQAVIGDLDSISNAAKVRLAGRVLHIPDQDSTDFDKAMTQIQAPFILALGFMGGRADHGLAVFSGLLRAPQQICILIGSKDIVFLAPLELRLNLRLGTRVSLFPMGAVSGQSQGLYWPIDGIDFAPDGMIGTSNRVSGPVLLRFNARKMLVILPVSQLDLVLQALVHAK